MKKVLIIDSHIKRFLTTGMLIIMLSGCSNSSFKSTIIPQLEHSAITSYNLLLRDDLIINNKQIHESTIKDINILELNQQIINFLQQYKIEKIRDPRKRFQALSRLVFDKNKLNLQYDESKTKTAVETFQTKSANCLSFSNLFIAMARHVNLPTHYQQVSIPPNWNREGNTMIINNHINVITKLKHNYYGYSKSRINTNWNTSPVLVNSNQRLPGLVTGNSFVADFDPSAGLMKYPSKIIPDDHAKALYYSNIGVEFLLHDDIDKAYLYTKKAIMIYPNASSPWNNLGNIYKRLKHFQLAEKVYLYTIHLDNNQLTAASNLVRLYQYLAQDEKATPYIRYIDQYRNSNPYYHFELGKLAIEEKSYTKAIRHLREAIKLKNDEDIFYASLAIAYYKRGMYKKAVSNMKKAQNHAREEKTKHFYSKKIKILKTY